MEKQQRALWLVQVKVKAFSCILKCIFDGHHCNVITTVTCVCVCSEGVCSEGVCSEGVCSEGVCSEGVCSEGVCSEGVYHCSTHLSLPPPSPYQVVSGFEEELQKALEGVIDEPWEVELQHWTPEKIEHTLSR